MNREQTAQVRQLVQQKRYEEAYDLLQQYKSDPDAQDMLESLQGVMDFAEDAKKRRQNAYSSRWTLERVLSNVTVSLVLLLIFRNPAVLIAIPTYWLYDVLFSPPGRLSPWHVGAAVMIAISVGFVAQNVLPNLA